MSQRSRVRAPPGALFYISQLTLKDYARLYGLIPPQTIYKNCGMKQAAALRQYFFYVDFKGFLHFEEEPHLFRQQNFSMATAIKDRRFLTQFYKNLQCSDQPIKYSRYPHLSQCWGQHNYVRSDIAPIVFNYLDKQQGQLQYSFQQTLKFDPKKLRLDNRGYIIYNFKPNINGVFGSDLVSQLAQDLTMQEGEATLKYGNEQIKIPKLEHL